MVNRSDLSLVTLTVDITSAYLNHNRVATTELPAVIESIHSALEKAREPTPSTVLPEPAVPIRASIKPDYLVCLEDGRKLKLLKRYLRTQYNLTPDEYRAKWGLPRDYPMVAPSYATHRASLAQTYGLGRKPTTKADHPAGSPEPHLPLAPSPSSTTEAGGALDATETSPTPPEQKALSAPATEVVDH